MSDSSRRKSLIRALSVFLLVVGLGSGLVLVRQQQSYRSQAQVPPPPGGGGSACNRTFNESYQQVGCQKDGGGNFSCVAIATGNASGQCWQVSPGNTCGYTYINPDARCVISADRKNCTVEGQFVERSCGVPTPPLPGPGDGGGGGGSCVSDFCAGADQCRAQGGTPGNQGDRPSGGKCQDGTVMCCGGPIGGGPGAQPKKVCGESCSVNTDCGNATTPGVSVICRAGFCENADCPAGQTVFGANCSCGSNSRLCGQTCGATVGLCAEGSCTYVGGPSCSVGAPTYCAGTLNGFSRPFCVDRDQGNRYLVGPTGKTSGFSEAEIKASCSTAPTCPVGGTTGRKSSCGGSCVADSDCRAPSSGGTAVCRAGFCENTACPIGKTLPGAACLCAGESFQTQQCGQPCYLGALCAPGQGICRYVNTGGNNCPWGWQQTYCVGTNGGFTTPQCAAGDTGGAYLVAPDGRSSGITLTELPTSCRRCGDGVIQPGEMCDDGAANGTSSSACDFTCKISNCSITAPVVTPTPKPVATPIGSCPAFFGSAQGYNLFVLEDLNHNSTDTEGKVAVGRNATFTKYNLGSRVDNSSGSVVSLIVGNNLTMSETVVLNGGATYGGTLSSSSSNFKNGTAKKATPPFSFTTASSTLNATAATWAGFSTNGTVNTVGDLVFTGTNSQTNVFKVAGSELAKARKIRITAPASSTVLINVTGTSVTVFGHQFILSGVSTNRIIYNFYEATTLKIDKTSVLGTVFAPKASMTFTSGRVDGMVIVKSLGGSGQINNGQINNHLFNGCPTLPGTAGGSAATPAPTGTSSVCNAPTLNNPSVVCATSSSAKGTINWPWLPTSGSNRYEIDIFRGDWSVAVDNGFLSSTTFNCASGQCIYTSSLAPGTYRARVRASGLTCTASAWSRTNLITLPICGQ